MKKQTIEEKALALCESARAQLMLRHPFVGRLGIQIPFVAVNDSRIHTIATNGKVIYIRPEWICSKPPVTLAATVAHSIWTAALCHSFRRGDTDYHRFDIASDIEVYNLLRVEKITMTRKPDFADLFPQYLPVEKLLEKLPDVNAPRSFDADVHLYTAGVVSIPPLPVDEEKEKKQEEKKQDCDNSNGTAAAQKADQDDRSDSRSDNGGTQQGESDKNGTITAEKPSRSGEAEEFHEADCECDPSMREVWRQRIIEAGQHYRMTYGSLPGELAMLVESFQEGKINYLQLLRRYLGQCSGGESHWLPPARRFVWQGQYLPSRTNPELEIVVAVDTSGSIDTVQFQNFIGEIYSIVRQLEKYHLTLIQCDSKIQNVQIYSPENPLKDASAIKIYGGGGTSFLPVFEYIKEKKSKPRVLLYYTDGAGRFPEKAPAYPVIWILSDDVEVPWGKKILIPQK